MLTRGERGSASHVRGEQGRGAPSSGQRRRDELRRADLGPEDLEEKAKVGGIGGGDLVTAWRV